MTIGDTYSRECPRCRRGLSIGMIARLAANPSAKILRYPMCKGSLTGNEALVNLVREAAAKKASAGAAGAASLAAKAGKSRNRVKSVAPTSMADAVRQDFATKEKPWYSPGELQGGAPGLGRKR